ncbi:MAG: hypothetical protein ACFE8Z_03705 [Candidatus Hermodarchaeota archaeon]
MQALEAELFTVSVILWVGTFAFQSWLLIRMRSIESSLRTLAVATDRNQALSSLSTRWVIYVAAVLEIAGLSVLGLGLSGAFVIPMYPLSIVIWAGVFLLLIWQMMNVPALQKSLDAMAIGTSEE